MANPEINPRSQGRAKGKTKVSQKGKQGWNMCIILLKHIAKKKKRDPFEILNSVLVDKCLLRQFNKEEFSKAGSSPSNKYSVLIILPSKLTGVLCHY